MLRGDADNRAGRLRRARLVATRRLRGRRGPGRLAEPEGAAGPARDGPAPAVRRPPVSP